MRKPPEIVNICSLHKMCEHIYKHTHVSITYIYKITNLKFKNEKGMANSAKTTK